MENVYFVTSDGELRHHGVKGQKWGVRRYQRRDGSLTPAGKKHVAERAGRLLDPNGSENTTHRQQVTDRYKETVERFGERLETAQAYTYQYAEATLKDLGFDTDRGIGSLGAKVYVRDLFESDDMLKRLAAARDAVDAKLEKDAIDEIAKMPKSERKYIQKIVDGFVETEWGTRESSIRRNIGDDDVTIDIQARKGTENASALSASKFLQRYNLDNDRESVVKEYYDSDDQWATSTRTNYSRTEFKNSVRLYSMTVEPNTSTFQTYWDDGDTYGGHSLVGEGNMNDLRVRYGMIEG